MKNGDISKPKPTYFFTGRLNPIEKSFVTLNNDLSKIKSVKGSTAVLFRHKEKAVLPGTKTFEKFEYSVFEYLMAYSEFIRTETHAELPPEMVKINNIFYMIQIESRAKTDSQNNVNIHLFINHIELGYDLLHNLEASEAFEQAALELQLITLNEQIDIALKTKTNQRLLDFDVFQGITTG